MSINIEHKDISVGEIHSPFQWEVLNVAELSTIVPEGVNDVRKVAFVVDDGTGNPTAYVLTQFTPAVEWKPLVNVVGGGGSVIWGGIGGTVADQADLVAYLQANFYTQAQINSFMNGYYTTSEIDVIASGKADLVGGLVPASQLPSYVDDVLEYANLAALPITGEAGKIYITLDTNRQYRWGGSSYIDITGFVDNVNGKTGAVVVTKEDVGLTNVDNTSDANKPISTATQTALNGKSNISHLHDDRYYTESEVDTLLSAKQNTITVDAAPTNGSTNPVQSNGVFDALALKENALGNPLVDGQVLSSLADGTRSWITPSSASTLDSLADVVITTPASGQTLVYNGTGWVNGALTLVTANDVEITNATKGVILKAAGGTRYRVTVDDDGSLVTTAVV